MTTVAVPQSERHPRWPHLNLSVAMIDAANAQFGPLDWGMMDRDNRIAELEAEVSLLKARGEGQ
jgi:hypothetical protein